MDMMRAHIPQVKSANLAFMTSSEYDLQVIIRQLINSLENASPKTAYTVQGNEVKGDSPPVHLITN
ncbi:MAG: hypothetical protein EA363_01755 [Balneolaceae bacterium]|nr:MAG: hypothetical protein EA363_01755 [Balneolaceae bacterium]